MSYYSSCGPLDYEIVWAGLPVELHEEEDRHTVELLCFAEDSTIDYGDNMEDRLHAGVKVSFRDYPFAEAYTYWIELDAHKDCMDSYNHYYDWDDAIYHEDEDEHDEEDWEDWMKVDIWRIWELVEDPLVEHMKGDRRAAKEWFEAQASLIEHVIDEETLLMLIEAAEREDWELL